jgi:AcrR family transcriptional regulator
MAQRAVPDYPSPAEFPELTPATARRAWGKVPYEQRFRRQRRDLLDAAAALAAEHGVAGTSVAGITSAAGLAKRVFYEHFADKEACFVELFREFGAAHLRFALDKAEAATGRSAWETIRSVIRALVTYQGADPRLVAAIRAQARPDSPLAAAYDEQHRQTAELLVAVARRLDSPLPEPTIRLAALLLVNGVMDLGQELRQRRNALNELSTIVCLAFGLSPEQHSPARRGSGLPPEAAAPSTTVHSRAGSYAPDHE